MGSVLKCHACGEETPVETYDQAVPPCCSFCFTVLRLPEEKAPDKLPEPAPAAVPAPPPKPPEPAPAAEDPPPAAAPVPHAEPPEVTAAAANARNVFGPPGPDGKPGCVLLGPLGQDATGAVYKAYDRILGRAFAVRFMAGQAGEKESALLDQRMQELVALPHPGILHVQGTGRRQNRMYIATDLVEADPLSRSKIPEASRLSAIFKDAAEAIGYAHGAGIFHGDVNPENILVARSGDHVYVKDFQLANLLETLARQAPPKAGAAELHNPAYLPPEQAKQSTRTPSAAGDIYGLGATLYTALAGRPPFEGEGSAKVFARIQMEEPPALEKLRPDLPEGLAAIVRRAMAKEPALRYATAKEMAEAFARFLKGAALADQAQRFDPETIIPKPDTRRAVVAPAPRAVAAPAPRTAVPPPKPPSRMPRWALPAAAGLLVVGGILFFVLRSFAGPGKDGPTPVATSPKEQTGEVELDLQPPPTEVRIDGRPIDASQKAVPLRGGKHRVEILFGDVHRLDRDIDVVPGGSEKIEIRAHRPIAEKHEERGTWADAERLYQEALALAGPEERREIQEQIARMGKKRLEAESSLRVESDPPGAAVTVDGKPSGRTPLLLGKLESGPRTLEFQLNGHAPETRRVDYEPGRTAPLRVELRPLTGKIRVRGLRAGDRVKVAGRKAEVGADGTLEMESLKLDFYELVVERANHDDARTMLRVEADKTTEVTGLVFKISPASLVVESAPAGAEVHLDGRVVGRTPLRLADLPPGPKKLRILHPERSDWDGEVQVKGGEKAEVKATLPAMAKLAVTAHPEGSRLTGALTGVTRVEARLKAGEHRVRLSHPEAGDVERVFRLAAGEEVADSVDLWQLRGDELDKAGKVEESVRAYSKARPEVRDKAVERLAGIWTARAEEFLLAKDWIKARQAAGQALKVLPAHARSREILNAVAYEEAFAQAEESAARSEWVKMKQALGRALAARPGDARALELSRTAAYREALARGLAMQKEARWSDSRRAFEQALAAQPGDAEAGAALQRLKSLAWFEVRFVPGFAFSAAFSPDGKTLATGRFDKTIQLWNLETGTLTRTLTGHTGPVSCVLFSLDGKHLVSGAGDAKVKVWELSTGAATETLMGHAGQIWATAYSPDGTKLATASEDRTLRLWDTRTWTEIRALSGHSSPVSSVAFSPDGRRLASAAGDKTIKLWDAERGEEQRTLTGHEGTVSHVVFSPDGKRLVSSGGDRTVRIWDLEVGRELRALSGHTSHVAQAAFTTDGRILVTVGGDKTIRLWDVETSRELRALSGHTGDVWSIALSADGTRMVSAGSDGTRLWGLQK